MQVMHYDDDSQARIKKFLESKGRNSKGTMHAYFFGLKHFGAFLDNEYSYPVTLGNIIDKIKTSELDVYEVLNNFIAYLTTLETKISVRTVSHYTNAVKSYLQHYDIDIIPSKFKNRVDLPKQYYEEQQPINREEIREILKACNNRRLKTYLYVLASCGARANEVLALRLGDVNFSESPTKVHIRKENKTRRPRDIFISDEATIYLKQWIDYKYRKRRIGTKMVMPEKSDNQPIFIMEIRELVKPITIYPRLNEAFRKVLKSIGLDERKQDSIRGKIVLNSFRHFVYTTIGDQTNTDYANWFLGHAHSTYWGKKPEEKADMYRTKCMNSLTFLDFSRLEASSKNVDARIDAKEKEIQILKQRELSNEEQIKILMKALKDMQEDVQELENMAIYGGSGWFKDSVVEKIKKLQESENKVAKTNR